jgi:hypothetical protein
MLALPLTSHHQRVGVGTTTNLPQIFPKTSSFSLTSFRTTINPESSHSKTAKGNSIISASGSHAGRSLPTATNESGLASTSSSSTSSSSSISTHSSSSASTGSSSSTSSSRVSISSIEISPSESLVGLKVCSDSACTIPIKNFNWGAISPGRTATATVYIKNTEDSNSLTLSIQASNWNPTSASQYLTLSWDKQGTVLAPGQSTEATITLTVSSSITGITSFNVQISVSGTG